MTKRVLVRAFIAILVCSCFVPIQASYADCGSGDPCIGPAPTLDVPECGAGLVLCVGAGACPGALLWDFGQALELTQKSMTVSTTYVASSCSGMHAEVDNDAPPPIPVWQGAYVGSTGRPQSSAALTGNCVTAAMDSGYWGRSNGDGQTGILYGGSVFVKRGGLNAVSEIDIMVPYGTVYALLPFPCLVYHAAGVAAPSDRTIAGP